jgi:hypothetical protein
MDLKRYHEAMRRFHEREGYYPDFGKPQSEREQGGPQDEAPQPTRPRFIPRRRRRPWK